MLMSTINANNIYALIWKGHVSSDSHIEEKAVDYHTTDFVKVYTFNYMYIKNYCTCILMH